MRLSTYRTVLLFLLVSGLPVFAKKTSKKADAPQDQIAVAAHLAIPGGPIVRFTATRHYGRSYIYAERGPGQPITLLDISDPNHPRVVSQLESNDTATLIDAVGTAAITTSAAAAAPRSEPQTIRLMDFSSPAQPRVTQQFDNVTAVEKISGDITVLSNPEGVWILSQHLAADPAEEVRYARKVIYGDSMY